MGSIELRARPVAVQRVAAWEALMVALAAAHAAVLFLFPVAPVIALGVWWNSNTISHNFIHRPFFRSRAANLIFAGYLSALLGIPQSLWRDRHLAHHAGVRPRIRITPELLLQVALILAVWMALALRAPAFFFAAYLPGYFAGLGLCALQGYYEHAGGVTSHYGALYNLLLFNDGYHAEHHSNPATHWRSLPTRVEPAARASVWPAPLRWMEAFSLEGLERLTLRWAPLRRFVLRSHERAFRELTSDLGPIETVAIVGGGLFPRTALIAQRLHPDARISLIDWNAANLDEARRRLGDRAGNIEFVHAPFDPAVPAECDLLVIPLSLSGNREAIYARPAGPAVLVHDWIWRKRGSSRIVSWWLLKRMNLVRQ